MSNRDRLIELLTYFADGYSPEYRNIVPYTKVTKIADYLLANGVIVPPCKVGDKYVMDTAKTIFEAWNDVTGALTKGTSWYYELESVIEDIVKLSFGAGVLYREEAEKALKEREQG